MNTKYSPSSFYSSIESLYLQIKLLSRPVATVLDTQTIEKLLTLSQIDLTAAERDKLAEDLDNILIFVQQMNNVATDDIEPLAHPIEINQTMRADTVALDIDQDLYQQIAPVMQEGYYIVPKVITAP